MPPGPGGRGREGEDGCMDQGSPPAAGHRCRDMDAPCPSSPNPPSPETSSNKKKLEDEEQRQEEEEEEEEQPMVSLPDGALVEILLRVPYRSLRRFKCVSKPWLALCSATDIRRRSPQTPSGFFHFHDDGNGNGRRLQFRNLSGRGPPMVDPSTPFLFERYRPVKLIRCCTSLLLYQCWKSTREGFTCDYVVCNPATQKCTLVPLIALPGREERSLFYLDNDHIFLDVESYKMFAIHPERDLIFLTDEKEMTISYDMDNQKVHVICTSGEFLGGLPYTPCFAE